jgi:hypothetical protein
MYCEDCARLVRRAPRLATTIRGSATEQGRVRGFLCIRCGRLLGALDPVDVMLQKMAQLDRFGLVSGAAPLLRASGEQG